MSNDYPLYPTLSEQGKKEAQKILDSFKPKLAAMLEEVLGELYTDVTPFVESDNWSNYRNAMIDGFKNYTGGKNKHEHDFKELRQAIYKHNKEEIINDLNEDLVTENELLKSEIVYLTAELRRRS